MQDITQIYDHSEYGEAYDGMARHVSAMSGLDRIIFEDCDLVSGKVCAPHENLVPYPHWLSVDYVAHKCACSYKEAKDLLDCWIILDATQEMVETFIRWIKLRGVEKALPYFERLAMALAEVENIDLEDVTENPEPEYRAPDEYAYHVIGEYREDEESTWMETQPKWFRKLIAKVRVVNNLDRLCSFGKEAYKLSMNHDQAGVFWTEYNLQKARLEAEVKLGPVARVFIQKIAKANGNLASLGAYLYKVQKGEVKVIDPPTTHEWKVIWKAYQERKEMHEYV